MGCTDKKDIDEKNAIRDAKDIEEWNAGLHRQKDIEEENALWDAHTERT